MPFFGPDSPLRGPRFWITCASLAVVASLALVDVERTAPGPLADVHALGLAAEGLSENDCAACHGGWFESMTGACYDCHDGIEADIAGGLGVHGTMALEAEDCATCHGEHNGPGFDLAGPRAYRLAGVLGEPWGPEALGLEVASDDELVLRGAEHALVDADGAELIAGGGGSLASMDRASEVDRRGREAIDHARFGFDLGGAHLDLACAECHTSADARPLPAGTPRFRGLDRDCASCHAEDHAPVFPQDCTTCHSQTDWEERSFAPHAAWFPREAAHADADCRACHAQGSTHSLEKHFGRRGGGMPDVRACTACHTDPHASDVLAAVRALGSERPEASDAGAAGIAAAMQLGVADEDSRACAECHAVTAGGFHTAGERMTPALHGAAGFELGPAHADVDCSECHAPTPGQDWPLAIDPEAELGLAARVADFGARHPGRDRSDCAACHADPHVGQFELAGPADEALDCADCHGADAFTDQRFDAVRHADLALPLTGSHAELDCASCHGAVTGATDPASLANALQEQLTDRAAIAAFAGEAFGGPAPEGMHAVLPPAGLEGDAAAVAQPTSVRVFRGTDPACAACHGDPHAGFRFADEATCAECHDDGSFTSAAEGFAHGQATGFALAGAHGQEDCASCHAPRPMPSLEGRSFGRVVEQVAGAHPALDGLLALNTGSETACALCHADPHGGVLQAARPFETILDLEPQIAAGLTGLTDCAACHTTASFRALEAPFDHQAETGFALEGRHGDLDCAACHSVDPGGARLPVRGADCASCHAEPHAGQFEDSTRGGDCVRCHTSARPFTQPTFRHDLDSDFPLDGRHAELACASCHGLEPHADAGSFRRYRPLASDCTSCHGAVEGSGVLRRTPSGAGR